MNYIFRPLRWSEPSTPASKRRSRFAFKASWEATLVLLERELGYLKATDIVIEADFTEGDIRMDGMLRSNARQPLHPGVRIAFDSKHGPLVYSTDSCESWKHNVRSIALGLQCLRAVDRYDVSKHGEQYTGWKQLAAAPHLSQASAWQILTELAAMTGTTDNATVRDQVIRRAMRNAHPDSPTGTDDSWHRFNTARRALLGADA